jgi:hypothetical protein
MLSVVVVWLRAASGAATKVDQAIAEVAAVYEKQIQEKVKEEAKKLNDANAAAAGAAKELVAAESEMRNAEADAAAAELPAQMLGLVSGRVEDRTYAKELTTVSVARGDLQRLSEILHAQDGTTPTGKAGVKPVDRIILYIDDLDRCRPQDVVRVLQVVHMLLAFELFVVVVAMDARWVEASLKQNYEWLADRQESLAGADKGGMRQAAAGGRVSPQDYLEKIFQISFWLEPMDATRAADYLKSLARAEAKPRSMSAELGGIEIQPIELDYMRALAAYVVPSPRRVKRLINAYRLLKARLSDGQLRNFVTRRTTDADEERSGPYQLAIGLLVIGTGAPTSAAEILKELAMRDPDDSWESVIKSFRERKNPDWKMASQVLETLMRTQKAKDVSEIRGWARQVGRFLLRGPTEDTSQTNAG